MIYYKDLKFYDIKEKGRRLLFDDNIYTFDIETTSYLVLNDIIYPATEYLNFTEKEKKECIKKSCMYIWIFGINDDIYYGRTWNEFIDFLNMLEDYNSLNKYVYVHNLAFEFQYLKSILDFTNVLARKSHKVMNCECINYNIIFRCSLFLTNVALEEIPKIYNLDVKKQVGKLDYSKLRHSYTQLTEEELNYCEYDCLVLYYALKKERENYGDIKTIPKTSTGKVRRELQEITRTNYKYRRIVNNAINTDVHVFNMLQYGFMGGYTHANWIYADTVLKNVDSWDETSAYPYVMVTHRFPSSEFKKCNIKKRSDMMKSLCYLLHVKFYNIESKYYNNFISGHKGYHIRGAKYDNGRIISCDYIEMYLTDIDFYLILDTYKIESYEIDDCYFANYSYLPTEIINFILDKYVIKTEFKGIKEKELEYQKEKNKFNGIYGMSVTNNIRDEVIYDNDLKDFITRELSNEEIIEALNKEKSKSFLSFAYGVWVTAYARNNLIRNIIKLDDYVVYADTDSIKLVEGYDKNIFLEYNESVVKKIEYVSKRLNIPINKFMPCDKNGNKRILGIFESETEKNHLHTYDEFITQGAKKYAYKLDNKIHITVAGVPKKASCSLKDLNDFRDNYIFEYKDTNKMLNYYCDNMQPIEMTDFKGNKYIVSDKSGCCLVPTSYTLNKSLEYAELITDNSSKRSFFKE